MDHPGPCKGQGDLTNVLCVCSVSRESELVIALIMEIPILIFKRNFNIYCTDFNLVGPYDAQLDCSASYLAHKCTVVYSDWICIKHNSYRD